MGGIAERETSSVGPIDTQQNAKLEIKSIFRRVDVSVQELTVHFHRMYICLYVN